MEHRRGQGILVLLLLNVASFKLTDAGDFALVADHDNGTIYAGSMGQALADFAPLPLSGVRRPVAVDYDPVEKMVYWGDRQSLPSPKISRARLDGSNQVTLVENLRSPEGVALDVESRTMYWTDWVLGHIGRIAMDGSGSAEIIIDNLDNPRTIVVDHDGGHIYWTEWGDNPRIERADFNGRNRITVIQDNLLLPNGVFIDSEGNLYWCDALGDKIEQSDLSGNNRRNITTYPGIHPYDLAVYYGEVYWTDWAANTLLRVHVSGRGIQNFGPKRFEKPGGLHIQEEPDYCNSFPCGNGATCVDVINGFSCQCPAGFQGTTCRLTDITGCVLTSDPSDVLIVPEWRAVYPPGDSVEYACPDGYQLSGSAVRVCKSDFTWSEQPAKCISRGKQEGAAHAPVVAIVAGGGGAFLLVVLVFVLFLFKRQRRSRNREDTFAAGAVYVPYAKDPYVNESNYQILF